MLSRWTLADSMFLISFSKMPTVANMFNDVLQMLPPVKCMALSFKEFCNQRGVAAYKATTNKTDD